MFLNHRSLFHLTLLLMLFDTIPQPESTLLLASFSEQDHSSSPAKPLRVPGRSRNVASVSQSAAAELPASRHHSSDRITRWLNRDQCGEPISLRQYFPEAFCHLAPSHLIFLHDPLPPRLLDAEGEERLRCYKIARCRRCFTFFMFVGYVSASIHGQQACSVLQLVLKWCPTLQCMRLRFGAADSISGLPLCLERARQPTVCAHSRTPVV